MPDIRRTVMALALLATLIALPAAAGAPKVVFAEEFSATW